MELLHFRRLCLLLTLRNRTLHIFFYIFTRNSHLIFPIAFLQEYSEDSNSEPDVDLENQYYNSKSLKEDDPRQALESFQKVTIQYYILFSLICCAMKVSCNRGMLCNFSCLARNVSICVLMMNLFIVLGVGIGRTRQRRMGIQGTQTND